MSPNSQQTETSRDALRGAGRATAPTARRAPLCSGDKAGFLALCSLVVSSACTNAGTLGTAESTTALRLEPRVFPAELPCGAEGTGLLTYVATLLDVTRQPSGPVFPLPSSPPTACSLGLQFTTIAANNLYLAVVDGYDRADLRSAAPGSRLTVSVAENTPVRPRWRWHCDASAPRSSSADASMPSEELAARVPVLARAAQVVQFSGCGDLYGVEPGAISGELLLDTASLDLPASCETLRVEISLDDAGLAARVEERPCQGILVIPVTSEGSYTVRVTAQLPDAGTLDGGLADYECSGFAELGRSLELDCS